ncbi:MAG TPA: M1 family aminopeptidase [Gemmatimonadales bacterium]|nr:M1 family aminopeptidase [Gemmatimonadales bacterium]
MRPPRLPLAALAALALALVGLAAPAAPLAAQDSTSNALRILNDRYTRSHDYDLVHQRIELRDFDWDSTALTGRVVTTALALRPGLDSLVLDAAKGLAITSVSMPRPAGSASGALRWRHVGDTLVVHLMRPAKFRDTVRFQVEYRAKIENGKGLTFFKAEPGRPHRPQQVWSQGEDMNNHYWFPTYDFPNDKTTWEVVGTVPAGFTLVSNGRLVADRRNRDGTRTMHWAQEKPASTYLVSIVVAPLARVPNTWRGRPVDAYVYREDSTLAPRLFRSTPDMMETYSRLLGVPYPWAKYAQTTVADFFGGMENVSATTLVDWLPDARAYADRPWYEYILIPHELAHQWFGDLVTIENWANMWLNEGFAEFLPGQYWATKGGAAHGRHLEDEYYQDEYDQFMQIDARRRMPLASSGSNNIYPKGALVLWMLKKQLGPERFWASLNRYLTRHAYDNAVSDDLRQAVLDATGENLDWFWGQWVYQAGYPAVSVTAQWDSAGRRVVLAVQQTQTDTATVDSTGVRFTTPAAFRMPLAVRVGTAQGDVVRAFDVRRRADTLVVDGVPSAPTMVVFDDGNRILKTLAFPQPTAWLATQLARDPDLWNRGWVIDQLAARRADTLAAQALAQAARSADYFSIRVQAAGALAAMPAAISLPALADAARDTAAAVRAAAVRALGQLGDPRGLAAARTAWTRDTSYEVRAAAVGALARLDATGATDVVRAALATPSYRDVIQNAALGVLVQRRDTTMLEAMDQAIGQQPTVALALGALAARTGGGRALALLTGHLDDERGWVRGWAIDAITRVFPRDAALATLRDAAAGLRRPAAQAAVAAAIAKLAGSPAS